LRDSSDDRDQSCQFRAVDRIRQRDPLPVSGRAGATGSGKAKDPRSKLLDVAIEHFGEAGFKGASTRAIAAQVGTMMSSITYHFGSKDGLYLAAARHIGCLMQAWMAPGLAHAEAIYDVRGDPDAAREALHFLFDHVVEALNAEENEAVARFIFREQAEPSEAFTIIYDGAMGAMFEIIIHLLLAAVGRRISEAEARLRSLTLFGQVLVFRVSRASVLRTNDWVMIGPEQLAAIKRVIRDQLNAIIDQILDTRYDAPVAD
jgi:AcrR family transcriptional regulator